MAKAAKGAPPMKEMSSPKKAGGGTLQKYSPSPTQKKKDERNKPKIVNLMHPNGTCYGWAFHNFYAAKDELKLGMKIKNAQLLHHQNLMQQDWLLRRLI